MEITRSKYALLVIGVNACPPFGSLNSEMRCLLNMLHSQGAGQDSLYSALGLANPDPSHPSAVPTASGTEVAATNASAVDGVGGERGEGSEGCEGEAEGGLSAAEKEREEGTPLLRSPSLPHSSPSAVPTASGTEVAATNASAVGASSKRPRIPADLFIATNLGVARKHFQIHFGQGIPNPIFDQVYLSTSARLKSLSHSSQESNCFKNSVACLMRLEHIPTSLKLQTPKLSLSDIHAILNQGGHYLRKLPLYFEENQNKLFKPEMPTFLAVFLKNKFGVDLPWLRNPALNFSQIEECVSRVLAKPKLAGNALPYLILNPFNNNGVPLHCVGLDCRWKRAIVWDPANVNNFEFSLQTLHELCDGYWTPSFRQIWCIYARA